MPLLSRRLPKIVPNVSVWISIGTTIIMFKIPMYTPVRSRGTMLATIRYGTPTMLAQQMPMPIIGTRLKAWFPICDRAASEIPARARQPACTRFPPKRWHNGSRNRADSIVTKL